MSEEERGAAERAARKRMFFRIRVGVLFFVLFVVVLYAVRDLRARSARNDWTQTLDVALVLVHVEGTAPVEAAALAALRDRTGALEARLTSELARYRAHAPPPFRFRVLGPTTVSSPPPSPTGDGPAALAKQAAALATWLRETDPAAGVVAAHYDARIYVCIRRSANADRATVEGLSEQGGRIGIAFVDLDETMVDLTLFVVTHELLHTLGASDKYDASGRARSPEGFAEPERVPLYPQRFVEVMARNRPLSEASEALPERLDELVVGATTAQEIGWAR